MPEDPASLIQRAQRRDTTALEELVDLYAARLYGFLFRLTGHVEDAEDLVQEVFVRVVRTIADYRHEGRFEAWLFQIAVNLARDRVRRTGRRPQSSSLEIGEECPGVSRTQGTPDRALTLAEDVDRLQSALAKLAAEEREVVMLRHYTSMSFAEIAELMGTPLGTALARSHRALGKLRKWMEASG